MSPREHSPPQSGLSALPEHESCCYPAEIGFLPRLRGTLTPCSHWNEINRINKRSTAVASTCDICGKGPSFGNNVSHSQVNPSSLESKYPARSHPCWWNCKASKRLYFMPKGWKSYTLI